MPPTLRITNVHRDDSDPQRVQADIAKPVWTYFFRGIFRGDPGVRTALIAYFFEQLYQECLKHPELDPNTWDESNEQRIAEILYRLNFRDVGAESDAAYNRGLTEGLATRGSDATGRTSPPTSVDQTQSSLAKPKSRAATTVRKAGKKHLGQSTGPNLGT